MNLLNKSLFSHIFILFNILNLVLFFELLGFMNDDYHTDEDADGPESNEKIYILMISDITDHEGHHNVESIHDHYISCFLCQFKRVEEKCHANELPNSESQNCWPENGHWGVFLYHHIT